MNTNDPNFALGLGLLTVGIGVMVALDPWYLGLVFLLIGAQRLFVAFQASSESADSDSA